MYTWLPSLKLCKTGGRLNLAPGLKFARYCFKSLNILGWPESSFEFFHNITEKPTISGLNSSFLSLKWPNQTIWTDSNICFFCWNAREGYDAERDGLNKALFKNVRNDMIEWIQLHSTKARTLKHHVNVLGQKRMCQSWRANATEALCMFIQRVKYLVRIIIFPSTG